MISRVQVLYNYGWNIVGQLAPALAAFVSFPIVVRELGVERFGILSLVWLFMNYVRLGDLGLGRATTKFIAEASARGEEQQLSRIFWTTTIMQLGLSSIASLILVLSTNVLVGSVFDVSADLVAEATSVFYLSALLVPFLFVSGSFRGTLAGLQRFDLINLVKIVANTINYFIPAVGAITGLGLTGIMIALLGSRALTTCIQLYLCLKCLAPTFQKPRLEMSLIRKLLKYGSWVTGSNIMAPILSSLDRVLIGALVSVSGVTYYTPASEVATQLRVIARGYAATIFPVFSAIAGTERDRLESSYILSVKFVLLIMGAPTFLLIYFAADLLNIWLGAEFAEKSTLILQLLAAAALLNGIAQVSTNFLDGMGRPDLRTKGFLAYTPVYIVLLVVFTRSMGIVGTAMAWLLRACVELFLFSCIAWKQLRMSWFVLVERSIILTAVLYGMLFAVGGGIVAVFGWRTWETRVLLLTSLALFFICAWKFLLEERDREGILTVVARVSKVFTSVKA